jgi:hypothetical protein
MSFDKFTEKYGLKEGIPEEEEFYEQCKWAEKFRVESTPTVFINGYEFPRQYSVFDMPILIRGMLVSESATKFYKI